ncbi:phosphonate C-P lyase system protein PhnH [Devosia sp.]|uniref:phosphonate C-P lyase system protein PhnH n=1 Tax=Devosia sp. TaxID=1871048 RepID=UPI003266EBF5
METLVLDGGFADPVMQSQGAFRALMNALANPGTVQAFDAGLLPPSPLTAELAAAALTLCDHDTQLYLAPHLATDAVIGWLRFHSGAPLTERPELAQFALLDAATAVSFSAFAQGSDLYPDRSTTLVLALPSLTGGAVLTLRGPGVDGQITIAPLGLPEDFLAQWTDNAGQFPRGIDLLLVADGQVIGLPRTTRISRKDA